MPRSRSMSIESSTCEVISRASSAPQRSISRSASVDLPWSMCATMAKLRMRERSVMESCARARGAPAMCGSVGLAPSLRRVAAGVNDPRYLPRAAHLSVEDAVRQDHELTDIGSERCYERPSGWRLREALAGGDDAVNESVSAFLATALTSPGLRFAETPLCS